MKIEKGMLLGITGWWFVLVEAVWKEGELHLHCICDNANNIYSHEPKEVEAYLSPKEVGYWNWGAPERIDDPYMARSIPFDVVTEVLTGRHDDRFDHWLKT